MKFVISAGAVVFYKDKFLLLEYSNHWGFVKGHIEKGETPEETVMRELEEEAGITDARIIPGFKETIGYYYREGQTLVSKKVIFFLIQSFTDKVKISYEHKGYAWLPYDEALKKLTFENARRILKKAHKFIQEAKVNS